MSNREEEDEEEQGLWPSPAERAALRFDHHVAVLLDQALNHRKPETTKLLAAYARSRAQCSVPFSPTKTWGVLATWLESANVAPASTVPSARFTDWLRRVRAAVEGALGVRLEMLEDPGLPATLRDRVDRMKILAGSTAVLEFVRNHTTDDMSPVLGRDFESLEEAVAHGKGMGMDEDLVCAAWVLLHAA